jgi:uncharacterized protein (TIGR03437 family)
VLLTLDTRSVDLKAPDTNPGTTDFPLAWSHPFGRGRVFYTALGHFDETWLDSRFQRMMLNAMLWLTGQAEASGEPRTAAAPEIAAEGVGNAASLEPRMAISPGSLISIFGRNLTNGSTLAAGDLRAPLLKLAGTEVALNGTPLMLLYVSPAQLNAYVPLDFNATAAELTINVPGVTPARAMVQLRATTPGIFAATREGRHVMLWATGLGAVQAESDLMTTLVRPSAAVGGRSATVLFSGLAPGWIGLYQINLELPEDLLNADVIELDFGGSPLRFPLSN